MTMKDKIAVSLSRIEIRWCNPFTSVFFTCAFSAKESRDIRRNHHMPKLQETEGNNRTLRKVGRLVLYHKPSVTLTASHFTAFDVRIFLLTSLSIWKQDQRVTTCERKGTRDTLLKRYSMRGLSGGLYQRGMVRLRTTTKRRGREHWLLYSY